MCKYPDRTSGSQITPITLDNYKIVNKIVHNEKNLYELFQAEDINNGDKEFILKMYLKPNYKDKPQDSLSMFWAFNEKYNDPTYECMQLLHIQTLIEAQDIDDIQFQKCLSIPGQSKSTLLVTNQFDKPMGTSLSQLCMVGNCRNLLKTIGRQMIRALKVLATGPSTYFTIDNISSDSVFLHSINGKNTLLITEMKFNLYPETNVLSRPWKEDMEKVGIMMAKLLAQDCQFIISEESRKSSLMLLKQITNMESYRIQYQDDVDVGVSKEIYKSGNTDQLTKLDILKPSIYDFIVRCLDENQQFEDPATAFLHPFLQELKPGQIDRPSDLI